MSSLVSRSYIRSANATSLPRDKAWPMTPMMAESREAAGTWPRNAVAASGLDWHHVRNAFV